MRNYFQGDYWTVEHLLEFRLAIQKARLTGVKVSIQTGSGQKTEFDPKSVNLDKLLDEIEFALNQEDPVNYPYANQRSGVTVSVFQ